MKLAQLRSLYKLIGRESRTMRKSVPTYVTLRFSALLITLPLLGVSITLTCRFKLSAPFHNSVWGCAGLW